MNKTIAGGLTAVLLTSGVGFTSAAAEASPSPMTVTRAAARALPLDLCDLLPALCGAPVIGPLLGGVDDALDDLVVAAPADVPQSVDDLVDAIVASLGSATPEQLPQVTNAIAALLTSSDLDPAVLDQVTDGLGTSVAGELVNNVVQTAQDLVTGLLGIGGQAADPAVVENLVGQLLALQGAGDTAGLDALLSTLLSSLPGGTGLDPNTLSGLVDSVATALGEGLNGGDTTPIINLVSNALGQSSPNPSPAASASSIPTLAALKTYVTTTRPRINGAGTSGASVTVRASNGTVLGTTTVRSDGSFSVVSRNLKRGQYTVTATQVAPGMSPSANSAARKFRVVSGSPAITTKSKKRFSSHRPKITGIGYPKSKIVLRTSTGKKLGTARVHSNGTWTIKTKRLTSGTKKLKATQTGHGKKRTSKTKKIRIR